MWNILIQTACSYTYEKYFKQLIKDYYVAICLQLCSYLQSNLQLCRILYTWCTEIPQLWDVEKDMWNILIQTACSYTIGKYFKQLIKYQQVAICLQLCSYLQSNLQLCRSLYTWCTEIPQVLDVDNVMWNILIQTACSYTYEKYFKQLIKDYYVAICLQLCSYLQSNLQFCRSLYTLCTEIPQLWDVEKDMWNILIQTACSYTIGKYFKQLIKYQQVAICLQLCSHLQSNFQICRSFYTWCTEIPQLWDVEKVMWNNLIQTTSQHVSQKDFKQLIKDYQVAICLQLCSYLQSNLQLCRSLYTLCTEIPQLLDVEKVMWNILIQTACSYTYEKYFNQLIKDQQVAICL